MSKKLVVWWNSVFLVDLIVDSFLQLRDDDLFDDDAIDDTDHDDIEEK